MLQLQWHFSSDESTYMTRLACFEEMPARLRRLTPEPSWPIRRVASALLTQLATLGYDYSGDATRQGNTTSLTVFSTTVWQDEMTPHCWHRTRHHLLLITINTLDAVIWFQPPHGHMSNHGSSYNWYALCYKRTGWPPNLGCGFGWYAHRRSLFRH
jgi:hypothetical protein